MEIQDCAQKKCNGGLDKMVDIIEMKFFFNAGITYFSGHIFKNEMLLTQSNMAEMDMQISNMCHKQPTGWTEAGNILIMLVFEVREK